MEKIIFTNIEGVPLIYQPQPAFKVIPEWYRDVNSYISTEKKPMGDGRTSATIKRCMPVFDAMVSGYIITSYVDVYVSQKELVEADTGKETGKFITYYEWPSYKPIEFHPLEQAPNHPLSNEEAYPKWINSWGIKTPPGYSTLFITPLHRDLPFTIIPGVVDTDTYTAAVNFPFVLNNKNFEGLIPAGTPIAQAIPFERKSWQMEIGNSEDFEKQRKDSILLRTRFFDSYKHIFRQVKEYK